MWPSGVRITPQWGQSGVIRLGTPGSSSGVSWPRFGKSCPTYSTRFVRILRLHHTKNSTTVRQDSEARFIISSFLPIAMIIPSCMTLALRTSTTVASSPIFFCLSLVPRCGLPCFGMDHGEGCTTLAYWQDFLFWTLPRAEEAILPGATPLHFSLYR